MRVKKYLALTLVALFAATMLTACPWDIEDDAASDSSSAPSSSSRPSHDSSDDDSGSSSAPSSPSTPDGEESENPDPIETLKQYGTVEGDTLTITDTSDLEDNDTFRNALNKASDITTISFDTGVTSIPDGAFKDCTNLTSVDLGNVTSIGGSAFSNCTRLTSIDLSNVTSIDVSAFQGCTALTSVDLSSVTSYIGVGAFLGCTNLAHIRLGKGMHAFSIDQDTSVDPNAFNNIASEVHVYYGESANAAQQKWEELDLTMASGTQVEYLPASEWENRENNDNAADALPGAMKGLLALAERLG